MFFPEGRQTMSDNEENIEYKPLVEEISEYVSTDVIQEMKSGIFNIFVSLYHHMTVKVGTIESMKYCILYLQEMIDHFQASLDEGESKYK
jgi:hypothetical protein